MPEFAHEVTRFQSFLEHVPYERACTLQSALDDIVRQSAPTFRETLHDARDARLIPPHICDLLEFLCDRWRCQSLPVKLALVVRLDALAPEPLLPAELLNEHPALGMIVREVAAATTSDLSAADACAQLEP